MTGEAEMGVMRPQVEKCHSHQKLGDMKTGFSARTSRRSGAHQHLISDFQPSEL